MGRERRIEKMRESGEKIKRKEAAELRHIENSFSERGYIYIYIVK